MSRPPIVQGDQPADIRARANARVRVMVKVRIIYDGLVIRFRV